MFAHWIWSLLILAAPIVIYIFIIRPRLQARFTELYADIDSFWGRLWARTYAFRTFVLASVTAFATALPDLLVQISSLDFSFLPQPWPMYTMLFFTVVTSLMKAYETKPKDEPA